MRPVNLIPPEDRRGDRAATRTGALPYLVLGGLAAALVAVTAVVYTGSQISDREANVAELEIREREASARAEALRPYAEFASLSAAREATVTSLSQSRFDWERVMRELSLVLPSDVWLTELTGSVAPGITIEGGADVKLRDSVSGPALAIVGCAASHEAVAGFLEALKDIDGVTRVGIATDERDASSATPQASSSGSQTDCRTRKFISRFEIVAAFDAVPTPEASAAPVAPASPAPAPASTGTTATPATGSASAGTGDAQAAANIVPGVAR
jgi:Tfp pilus assembly protein PilN